MSKVDWDYGGAYKTLNMEGDIYLPNDSMVRVQDLTLGMPEFMKQADTLFIDPPWNTGNIKSFYTKADMEPPVFDFLSFAETLWDRIDAIAPATLFLEMGKEHLHRFISEAEKRWKYVTFYNSTYYHKKDCKTYVIHATNDFKTRRYKPLEDMDEEDIIAWICANHAYKCIGDLCMGRGLVGRHAYANGKQFVGTELNLKRLAVLIDRIQQAENERLKRAA